MAMRKGYCVKCKTDNQKRRIFAVNSEAIKCYCPRCLAEYKPKEAINNYNKFINDILNDAYVSLHLAVMPETSYQKYADVIELEPDNVQALTGRLLSLIYLSTLRHSTFKEVAQMIDIDANRYHLSSQADIYMNFLRSAKKAVNTYGERILKRLTFKNYFYNIDCIILYENRLEEIMSFLDILRNEFVIMKSQIDADSAQADIDKFIELSQQKFITSDGMSHRFAGFSPKHTPIILATHDKKIKTGLEKYRDSTLDQNDKKLIVINDVIFKSNKTKYRVVTAGLATGITFGGISTILVLIMLLCLNYSAIVAFYILLVFAVIFALFGGSLLILQGALKIHLKKSHL